MDKTTLTAFDLLQEACTVAPEFDRKAIAADILEETAAAPSDGAQHVLAGFTLIGALAGAFGGVDGAMVPLTGAIVGGFLGGLAGYASNRAGALVAAGTSGLRHAVTSGAALVASALIAWTLVWPAVLAGVALLAAGFGYRSGGDAVRSADLLRVVRDMRQSLATERVSHRSRIDVLREQVLADVAALVANDPDVPAQESETIAAE